MLKLFELWEKVNDKLYIRKKAMKSAASLRAYRTELMREAERNQLKQVHEEKDGRVRIKFIYLYSMEVLQQEHIHR